MRLSTRYYCILGAVLFARISTCFCQDTTGLTLYPTFIASYLPRQAPGISGNNPYLIGGSIISYKNVYAEVRYNYEQSNTFGIYAGRSFVIARPRMEHVFTPQLGIMLGDYRGGSFQFYYLGYHNAFDISFLNQYSVPVSGQSRFYYNWSGVDFRVYKAFRLGVSGQYYSDVPGSFKTLDAGCSAALKTTTTTLQVYWFNGYDLPNQFLLVFLQQKIFLKRKRKPVSS